MYLAPVKLHGSKTTMKKYVYNTEYGNMSKENSLEFEDQITVSHG